MRQDTYMTTNKNIKWTKKCSGSYEGTLKNGTKVFAEKLDLDWEENAGKWHLYDEGYFTKDSEASILPTLSECKRFAENL